MKQILKLGRLENFCVRNILTYFCGEAMADMKASYLSFRNLMVDRYTCQYNIANKNRKNKTVNTNPVLVAINYFCCPWNKYKV